MRKLIKITAFTLIMSFIFTATCFADLTGENGKVIPSVTVNIPVKHVIKGDKYKGKAKFEFTLAPERADDPMPQGSSGNKTISVTASEKVDFGDIVFTYPDAYYYTITRTANDTKYLEQEDIAYRVMVAMYNNGTSQLVCWDQATGEKVDEMVFTDTYKTPKSSSPKTGDILFKSLITLAVIAFCSAIGLIILKYRNGKETIDEE